jgi:uncharacterized cupin superfamily protein
VIDEAPLEETGSGLAPARDGWFVLNVADAAWATNPKFGAEGTFETRDRRFPGFGIDVSVLQPGQPNCYYHREARQECFLVLSGECLLLVEGEERRLRAWDFVHCPPWTEHVFVGAGDGPCAILMIGQRPDPDEVVYPVSELALRHGAGVEAETGSPAVAYAGTPEDEPVRPDGWDSLPWT